MEMSKLDEFVKFIDEAESVWEVFSLTAELMPELSVEERAVARWSVYSTLHNWEDTLWEEYRQALKSL